MWLLLALLAAKEGLFRYVSCSQKKVDSSMLVAKLHARSDAVFFSGCQ